MKMISESPPQGKYAKCIERRSSDGRFQTLLQNLRWRSIGQKYGSSFDGDEGSGKTDMGDTMKEKFPEKVIGATHKDLREAVNSDKMPIL